MSYAEALRKAELEYKMYQAKILSSIEKDYLDTIKTLQQKVEKKVKTLKNKGKK